jgi:diguanylate cyclase (GGDEF)-like protein
VRVRDERLEALIAKTPDYILWIDRRGHVVDRNPAAYGLADVVDPLPEVAYAVAEARGSWSGEVQLLHRDGSLVDASAVVINDDDVFVAVLRDISTMKRAETALRRMAERDALTGLRNRHVLLTHLDTVVQQATSNRPSALLYIDLDHLKMVNDSGGHAAGDRYLEQFAAALEVATRSDDLVARVGGDEFAIVMRDVPDERAVEIAENVRDRLSGMEVSASIGVAVIDGSVPPNEVLAQADSACYAAKAKGGDAVHLFGT